MRKQNKICVTCKTCGAYKSNYARGFCRSCYRKDETRRLNSFFGNVVPYKPKHIVRHRLVNCWRCEKQKPHFALNLCTDCYPYLWEYVDKLENPKYYKEMEKRHHERRRDKMNLKRRLKYEENPEIIKQRVKKWRSDNPESVRATRNKAKHNLKLEFLDMLGNECVCDGKECWHQNRCGINHPWVLQSEHIYGDGAFDKKRFTHTDKMRRYYLKHPEEAKQKLRLFCANCNWFKLHKKKEFNQYTKPFLLPISSLVVSSPQM